MKNMESMNDMVEMPESIADIGPVVEKMKAISEEWSLKTPETEEETARLLEIIPMLTELIITEENQEEFNTVASEFLKYVRSESLAEVVKKKMKLGEVKKENEKEDWPL